MVCSVRISDYCVPTKIEIALPHQPSIEEMGEKMNKS